MSGYSGRITHSELVELGYIFLTKRQEDIILRAVNDEFARLVGQEAAERIAERKADGEMITEADIRAYLTDSRGVCEDIVSSARARVLRQLRERRMRLLIGPAEEEYT